MRRLIAIFLMCPAIGFAQGFVAEAALPAVGKEGFYSIPLRPNASAWLEADFRNIRILDEDGTEVPYTTSIDWKSFINVPVKSITSVDSVKDQTTRVFIRFDTTHFVDSVRIDIEGPAFYKRAAMLFADRLPAKGFDIISTSPAGSAVSTKTSRFELVVYNDDNPSLRVKDVTVLQRPRVLKTWLESGKKYRIAFGIHLEPPVYDLPYFTASIPESIPSIAHEDIKVTSAVQRIAETPSYFSRKQIIWIAIVLVAAVLAVMSFKMIREKSAK